MFTKRRGGMMMSEEEFYEYCAKNGEQTVTQLKEHVKAVRCHCGEKQCKGWQLIPAGITPEFMNKHFPKAPIPKEYLNIEKKKATS